MKIMTVVGYHNGTLLYLNEKQQDDRTFREGVLLLSVKDFQTYSVFI